MQATDSNDNPNRRHTDELLAKSRALKERTKVTNDKLDRLKERADKLKEEENNPPPRPAG